MGKAFLYGKTSGSGVGGLLTVSAPAGATITLTKDGKVKTKTADSSGSAIFKGLESGYWEVVISDGAQTASRTVQIITDYSLTLGFSTIPDFTYTGDYEIINDAGNPITTSQDNWQIRLLTSGDLKFTELNGAKDGVDIFLVGGGAGGSAVGSNGSGQGAYQNGSAGGGSGYTITKSNILINTNISYQASIGAGGAIHTDGGATSIAIGSSTYSADGGKCSTYNAIGGNGGSGGGGGGYQTSGNGGADGYDGGQGTTAYNTQAGAGGTGQGSTTRAFGDTNGVLYATGGGAGGGYNTNTGASMPQGSGGGNNPNTGDGGKGGGNKEAGGIATAGGSGVIIIRNHRTT